MLTGFCLWNQLITFRLNSVRHTSKYTKHIHIRLVKMRPTDSWDGLRSAAVSTMSGPYLWSSAKILLPSNDLIACFNACSSSFGFRLNPNWHSQFSLCSADVQKIARCLFSLSSQTCKTFPQHLILITFVLLPSNITRDSKFCFVLQIPYQRSMPGFSMVTMLFIHCSE